MEVNEIENKETKPKWWIIEKEKITKRYSQKDLSRKKRKQLQIDNIRNTNWRN